MASNLPAVGLAVYSLCALPHQPYSVMHRICLIFLALSAVGSAAHHALPLVDWTYHADIVPMLAVAGFSLTYALIVLAKLLTQTSWLRDALLACGLTLTTLQSMSNMGAFEDVGLSEAFMAMISANLLAHGVLWSVVLLTSGATLFPMKTNADQTVFKRRVTHAYLAMTVACAVAFAAQRVEAEACPEWLQGSFVGVHAVWHLLVYWALFNALALLLFVEHRSQGVEWLARWPRLPWLLFHARVAVTVVPTNECGAAIECASPARGQDSLPYVPETKRAHHDDDSTSA